jgi:hypothetical protein
MQRFRGSEHCRNWFPAVGRQPLALFNWFNLVQVHMNLSSREAEVEYLLNLSHPWREDGRQPLAIFNGFDLAQMNLSVNNYEAEV